MSDWKTDYDNAVATVQDILFNKYKLDPNQYYRCCSGVDSYFGSHNIKKIDKCINLPGWHIYAWFTLSGPEYYATMGEAIERFMMIPSYKDVACDRFDPLAPARGIIWKDPKGLANKHFPYYNPGVKKDGRNSSADDGRSTSKNVDKKRYSCDDDCPNKYTDVCNDCPFNPSSKRDEVCTEGRREDKDKSADKVAELQRILFDEHKLSRTEYLPTKIGVRSDDLHFNTSKRIETSNDGAHFLVSGWFGCELFSDLDEAVKRFLEIPPLRDVHLSDYHGFASPSVSWKDPRGKINEKFRYLDPCAPRHTDVHETCHNPWQSQEELDNMFARQGIVRNHALKGKLSRLDTLLGVTPRRQSETWLWNHGFVPASESFRFTPDAHNEPSNAISLETDKWTRDIDVVCKTNSELTFKIKLTVLLIDGKWRVDCEVVAGEDPRTTVYFNARVKIGERCFKNAELHDTVEEAFGALHAKIEAVYDKLSDIEEAHE